MSYVYILIIVNFNGYVIIGKEKDKKNHINNGNECSVSY